MEISIIRNTEELSQVASSWDALLRDCRSKTPFQTFEWMSACARWKEKAGELFVLTAYEGGELVGAAPLTFHHTRMNHKTLYWIGGYDGACDYQMFLIKPGCEARFYDALIQFLKENKGLWNEIYLADIPADLFDLSPFIHKLEENGLAYRKACRSVCYRFSLPDSWSQYTAGLSYNFRDGLEGNARKLRKNPCVQFGDLASTDSWEKGMEFLFDLHQKRWQSKGEPGVFARDATRQMHLQIVSGLRKKGLVRIPVILNGDEPLAVKYLLCMDGVAYSYLSGCKVDPTWGKFSLGHQIHREAIKYCVENGFTSFDFLRGDEPYKQRYGAQPFDNTDLHIFASNLHATRYDLVEKLVRIKQKVPARYKQWIKKTLLGKGNPV